MFPTVFPVQATAITMEQTANVTWQQALTTANNYMLEKNPNPTFGSEWNIISFARGNQQVPENYYSQYYSNVVAHVQDVKGVLDRRKYTEYSRTILALTAIGQDPRDVGGYNLVEKLYDYNQVIWQGVNGPIFALIALDTWQFQLPQTWNFSEAGKTLTTREKLIQFILAQEITDAKGVMGGFALSGENPDVDITAMAIQALSTYQHQAEVKAAIDRAVSVLVQKRLEDGGYTSWGVANVESAAQVIVALTSLGIDPMQDSRFSKVFPNILTFYSQVDGGFKHIMTQKTADGMATEQVGYTLAAYKRMQQKQSKLYDMTDTQKDYTNAWQTLFPTYSLLSKQIQKDVPVDYAFSVNFNQIIQAESNKGGKLAIWDAQTHRQVATQIGQGDNPKSLQVKSVNALKPNHYYYLVIHEGTVSAENKVLKPGIIHIFETK